MLIYYICHRSEAAAETEKEEAECKIIFTDFSDKMNAGERKKNIIRTHVVYVIVLSSRRSDRHLFAQANPN